MLDVRHRVVKLDIANFAEEIFSLVFFGQVLNDYLLTNFLPQIYSLIPAFQIRGLLATGC